MKNSKFLKNISLFYIFLISARSFANDCIEPVEFSKSFYKEHAEFYSADPKYVKSKVTSELYTSLSLNWACAIENEGLCIDYNPWSSSNSIELGEPISVTSEMAANNIAKVKFTFEYKWSENAKPDLITDFLLLKKEDDSCWKVNDLILNSGEHLSKIIQSVIL